MQAYKRFSNLGQLAASVGLLAVVLLLLDSGGLYSWAQRLDVGPERKVALPVATALHRALEKIGLERERQRALVGLAKWKWSDDPALLAVSAEPLKNATPATIAAAHSEAAPATAAETKAPSASVVPLTPALPLKPLAGTPPLVTKLPDIDPVGVGEVRTVALAGDSMMAVGLSPALLRAAPQYKDLSFVKVFKSGTGLARPEVFNWQIEYPAMLKAAGGVKPEYILVAIGANDGQGFVEDGTVYPFGTDEWQAIYQRRVQAYLTMLEADGATVVWLGLPPMKSDNYDDRIALVNRIAATVVNGDPHAIWFSTAGIVGDAQGKFRDMGDVGGKTVRLRQGDGIHLSDDGAALLVKKLLPWLGAQETAPVPAKPANETAQPSR